MGEIPHSEKMFHLPIEVSVYVPSTQDVDKVVSKSEMKLRVDEVKKYLATLFGGFSSSSVEGGFLASDGKVVKENVERVVSFAPKEDFDKNKEALVQKASEWATKWGQEAIGLEHEGDLYYVPQKFENGGTIAIREAKEMANSQAIKIKHHVTELSSLLKSNPTIEAWVIAKLESASNDLADVTHYLDGRVQMSGKKMAKGGGVGEKMIKVKVVYLEQQYFELEKEMEIPFSVYKEYDKTGKVPRELEDDLMSETIIDHWVETNAVSVRLTPITSEKMATGGQTQAQQNKIAKVMGEFKDRKLHSSSGDLVTDRKQAIAIALSEAGIERKMEDGGEIYGNSYSEEGFNLMKKHLEETLKRYNLKYYIEDPNAKRVEYVIQGIDIHASITIYRNYDNYFGKFFLYVYSEKLNPRTQTKTIKEKKVLDDLIKQISQISKVMTPEQIAYKKQIDDLKDKLEDTLYMYGDSDEEQKAAMKTSKFKNLERELELLETEYSKKMEDGGSIDPNSMEVQFIKYKDEEIMYEPHFKEFYVNDSMFHSLEEAKEFIDGGAPMSNELKEAYRKGLFEDGGTMPNDFAGSEKNVDGWNQDYTTDPITIGQKRAKETATRVGMAIATRGASEISRKTEGGTEGMSGDRNAQMASLLKGMR